MSALEDALTADIREREASLLRFAFCQGSNRTIVREPVAATPRLLATTAGARPGQARPERATPLPFGTADLLEAAQFPAFPAAAGAENASDRLGHALVTAFGPQRRELANAYNDHRGFPSVRSKFPVHAFVTAGGRHWWLDVYRHALLDMDVAAGLADSGRVMLAARYSDLPDVYGDMRGPLTELELGISLRALCVAYDLFGLRYRIDLPDGAAEPALRQLKLDPVWGWSLPVAVRSPAAPPSSPPAAEPAAAATDALLREAVAVNRMAALRPADTPAPGSAIPACRVRTALSWAEVLWTRSSGGMPRGLYGVAGRRQPKPFTVVREAIDWLLVPPPAALLRQVMRELTVTVCLQDIEDHPDGVYRLADGAIHGVRQSSQIGTEMERDYLHPQTMQVGCGVRLANMIWVISVRARQLINGTGLWAWPLALLVSGWMTQGLCLAAAAHGLYARPARAFSEIQAQRLLGFAPDELILIGVTCGTSRHFESALDLRI